MCVCVCVCVWPYVCVFVFTGSRGVVAAPACDWTRTCHVHISPLCPAPPRSHSVWRWQLVLRGGVSQVRSSCGVVGAAASACLCGLHHLHLLSCSSTGKLWEMLHHSTGTSPLLCLSWHPPALSTHVFLLHVISRVFCTHTHTQTHTHTNKHTHDLEPQQARFVVSYIGSHVSCWAPACRSSLSTSVSLWAKLY